MTSFELQSLYETDENDNLVYPEGVEPIVTRTTDRTNFKKCRRLWHFSSPLRQNREPVRVNDNLSFGISMHKGWEAFYHPDNQRLSLLDRAALAKSSFAVAESEAMRVEGGNLGLSMEREQEYADRMILGIGMLDYYCLKVAPKEDEGWTFLDVERKFQVPVEDGNGPIIINGRPLVYQVRIDLLAKDSEGNLWVWDHKTAANVSGDTFFLDIDTQISSYQWAVQKALGVPVKGVIYNEVAKTVPTKPKVLKNGSLSQDKRQNTTYDLYVQAIEDLGLDSEPYSAMLEFLRSKPQSFYRRTPIQRNQRELLFQEALIREELRDMTSSPAPYPNPSKMHCGGCDFKAPCLVANELGDVEFMLKDPNLYQERQGEG
jgi:hypothetical protein